MPDVLIASVPEVPEENDNFNINALLAKGGVMSYRWVNLYGVPGDERAGMLQKIFSSKQKTFEGTAYLGRILMSVTLSPNEAPTKGRFPLNSYREPATTDYTF
mmetsp:Transcript_4836/g.4025  ORF Transcript_4836/g.4025 Transcript_4836/m.4025 type:complete len:103 (-) Transcript_4836:3818-4126(-)